MFSNISDYFSSLNNAGQALFIVGGLLVITFIILLIIVLKPEKKPKKIYGESIHTDRENQFEEKMKNIDSINEKDINIDNDKTRNLKHIVDELKQGESRVNKSIDMMDVYENEQEDTAVISVNELLKNNYSKSETVNTVKEELLFDEPKEPEIENIPKPLTSNPVYEKPKKFVKSQEVFSSVFLNNTRPEVEKEETSDNEKFLNTLKEFRNNL